MASSSTFLHRVVLLLALMLIVGAVDYFRNGTKATRFREYGFILVTGLVGAMVGGCVDFLTSSYSPEYFVWGKGLKDDATLRREAVLLGLRVGFSAGVIGGAICLFACCGTWSRTPASFPTMYRALWIPVIGAIFGGVVVPLIFSKFDPGRFTSHLDFLGQLRIDRFKRVWWTHTGLYAGLLCGLVSLIFHVRKKRAES
jgi:Mn2+/Fe2+ NRAMP family transporter